MAIRVHPKVRAASAGAGGGAAAVGALLMYVFHARTGLAVLAAHTAASVVCALAAGWLKKPPAAPPATDS